RHHDAGLVAHPRRPRGHLLACDLHRSRPSCRRVGGGDAAEPHLRDRAARRFGARPHAAARAGRRADGGERGGARGRRGHRRPGGRGRAAARPGGGRLRRRALRSARRPGGALPPRLRRRRDEPPAMNPMIRKELRQRMRERRAWLLPSLYLLVLGAVVIVFYMTVTTRPGSLEIAVHGATLGQGIFLAVAYAQLSLLLLVAPVFSAGGLYFSCFFRRSVHATSVTYAFIVALTVVPLVAHAVLASLVGRVAREPTWLPYAMAPNPFYALSIGLFGAAERAGPWVGSLAFFSVLFAAAAVFAVRNIARGGEQA